MRWSSLAGVLAGLLLGADFMCASEATAPAPLDPVAVQPPPVLEDADPPPAGTGPGTHDDLPQPDTGLGVPPAPIDPWPATGKELSLLTYNIYMRPTSLFKNGQMIRAELLPEHLLGLDLVILNEAFDDDARARLLNKLGRAYPYQSRILGSDTLLGRQDGGVIVLSRWPILSQAQRRYGAICKGSDCLSDKGVLYVRICKEDTPYHVFATHTQAHHDFDSTTTRQQQLAMIRGFIDELNIPAGEPVIVGGDLNVWKFHPELTAEYRGMLEALQATDPAGEGPPGMAPDARLTAPCTYCYGVNDLASDREDGQSVLDYLLVSRTHAQPAKAAVEILRPRSGDPWKEYVFEPDHYDLSDHFALYGHFAFLDGTITSDCQGTLPPPPPPDFGEYHPCDPLVYVPAPDAPSARLSQSWGDGGRSDRDRIQVRLLETPPGSGVFEARVWEGTAGAPLELTATNVRISAGTTRPYRTPVYPVASGVLGDHPQAASTQPAFDRDPQGPPAATLPPADRSGSAGVFGDRAPDGRWSDGASNGGKSDSGLATSLGLSLPRGIRLEVDLQCDERLSPRVYQLRYLRTGNEGKTIADVMLRFTQPAP